MPWLPGVFLLIPRVAGRLAWAGMCVPAKGLAKLWECIRLPKPDGLTKSVSLTAPPLLCAPHRLGVLAPINTRVLGSDFGLWPTRTC